MSKCSLGAREPSGERLPTTVGVTKQPHAEHGPQLRLLARRSITGSCRGRGAARDTL
jgi:hypothetical protein